MLWLLWVGRARHPGPFSGSMSVEVFNVGGWAHTLGFGLGNWC